MLQAMVESAEQRDGPNDPHVLDLKEQLRAAQQAPRTAYQQFTLGSHELGPEKEES